MSLRVKLHGAIAMATNGQTSSKSKAGVQERPLYSETVSRTPSVQPLLQCLTSSSQCCSPPNSQAQQEGDGFTLVQRKRERARQTKNIVGESMVRNTTKFI